MFNLTWITASLPYSKPKTKDMWPTPPTTPSFQLVSWSQNHIPNSKNNLANLRNSHFIPLSLLHILEDFFYTRVLRDMDSIYNGLVKRRRCCCIEFYYPSYKSYRSSLKRNRIECFSFYGVLLCLVHSAFCRKQHIQRFYEKETMNVWEGNCYYRL